MVAANLKGRVHDDTDWPPPLRRRAQQRAARPSGSWAVCLRPGLAWAGFVGKMAILRCECCPYQSPISEIVPGSSKDRFSGSNRSQVE